MKAQAPGTSSSALKASDLLVRSLENEDLRYIFGVPGEENADFMMSLSGSSISFVSTRHEQGAAFMAEVYGRLTGNPAACLGTLGPGATNLITGVADANMDRAPMLVLTGQAATTRQHKESHQVMDVVQMYRPVTKWATAIQHPDSIPEIVRKAVRVARSEKPGAVHLELAEDVAKLPAKGEPLPVRRFRRPSPEDQLVVQVHKLLQQAERPLILAGNGTIRKRASAELRALCELTGIGVLSTFMAKGCVDVDAPYSLFTIGLQAKDLGSCAVDAADLILCVGYDLVEYHPHLWNAARDKRIVHIDFLPAEVDANYHPEVELVGDVAQTLRMLRERIAAGPALSLNLGQQAATRRQMLEELAQHADDDTEGSIRPQKVLWDVRQALGPNDLLLSDVGAHKMWIARHYHCHEPNTCLIPNGFCSMGFALPGAIGARLVDSERRILAICGDGGFLMNVQEMETARRLESDINVMVWEDGGYGLIGWKQQNEFGRQTDLSFGNPDWRALGTAFGWHVETISRSRDLLGGLGRALSHRGPSLIVVPIDYRENMLLSARLGEISCPI